MSQLKKKVNTQNLILKIVENDISYLAKKRSLELEAMKSFKKKMKEKHDKAKAELEEFFNRCSSSDNDSDCTQNSKLILERRKKVEIYNKKGEK